MRALGERDLPESFEVAGKTYRREREIKHDFFAATGFYLSDQGERVVLKMSRSAHFCGVPLIWLGRWLCRREIRFYRVLADLPNAGANWRVHYALFTRAGVTPAAAQELTSQHGRIIALPRLYADLAE